MIIDVENELIKAISIEMKNQIDWKIIGSMIGNSMTLKLKYFTLYSCYDIKCKHHKSKWVCKIKNNQFTTNKIPIWCPLMMHKIAKFKEIEIEAKKRYRHGKY